MSAKRLNFEFHLYFYSGALMLVCMLKIAAAPSQSD